MPSQTSNPAVSIIIPCYNAERWIPETIENIRAQTYADWELIVVDDGSSDGSARIVQSHIDRDSRIKMVRQANAGLPAARNAGARAATGTYIAFIDADDLWDPAFIAMAREKLEQSPDCIGCACDYLLLDDKGNTHAAPVTLRTGDRVAILDILERAPWPVHAGLIRRSAFDRTGGFDESLRSVEDWDFWLRLLIHGNFCMLHGALALYRQYPGQMSKNHVRMGEHFLLVAQRFHHAHQEVVGAYGERAFYLNVSRLIHLHAAKALSMRERTAAWRLTFLAWRVSPASLRVYRDSAVLWLPQGLVNSLVRLKRLLLRKPSAQVG